MQPMTFLRNTWKKLDRSRADKPDESKSVSEDSILEASLQTRASKAAERSLTISSEPLPNHFSPTASVHGTWQSTKHYEPASPIYDQFTHDSRSIHIISRHNSSTGLDTSYRNLTYASDPFSADNDSFLPAPPSQLLSASPFHPPLTNVPIHDRKDSAGGGASHLRLRKMSAPSSPHHPKLPSFHLLPPIDLNYGPGSRYDMDLVDKKMQQQHSRPSPPAPTRPRRCPELYTDGRHRVTSLPDGKATLSPARRMEGVASDAKPHRLYRSIGSSPHLPHDAAQEIRSRSGSSTCSADSGDGDHFPLSLFPAPPPLTIRKHRPTPLVLQTTSYSTSSQSSADSTPIATPTTPTTPRFGAFPSPSQLSLSSPTGKSGLGRSIATVSPPPSSPPNSPLPSLPAPVRPLEKSRLRGTSSSINLREGPTYLSKHRLTSSEPVADRMLGKPSKQRSEDRLRMVIEEKTMTKPRWPSSPSATDGQVQWGYAY